MDAFREFDRLIFEQELSEVFLLLDFISGRPDKHLTDLTGKLSQPDEPGRTMTMAEIVERVALLRYPPSPVGQKKAEDVAFLLALKDLLNSMAYPARGLTIAYTIMFAEETEASDEQEIAPSATNRVRAARLAFPGLIASAARLRRVKNVLAWFGLGITMFSAVFLWQVTYGVQLTSRFVEVKQNEKDAITRIYDAVERLDRVDPASIATIAGVCGGSKPAVGKAATAGEPPEVRQLCADYAYQHGLFCVTISDIGRYSQSWMFGASQWLLPIHRFREADCGVEGLRTDPGRIGRQEDAPSVAGMLAMMINYMLPILFGLVGTVAALVRGIQDKATASVLEPRDRALSLIRLPLGMMAGVCVGLFFNPTAMATQIGGGLTALTLSASGVAFLAGYGAEGFFRMLDMVLRRVFNFDNGVRSGG